MTYRVRNIGLALVLAVLAALLTAFYVTNYKRTVQKAENSVTVLVAKQDIPAGTPGSEVLEGHLLSPRDVTRRTVVPGAITSGDEIEKLVATQTIFAGEQVTTRRFTPVSRTGIRTELKGNVRAFQLSGDPNQLLVGTLRGGDFVDVVATWEFPEGGQTHVSRVILRDLKVLRIGGGGSVKITSGPNNGQYVILALTDSQSQKLMWAIAWGEWHLALRAPVDAAESPERAESSATLLADGLGPKRLARDLNPFGVVTTYGEASQ